MIDARPFGTWERPGGTASERSPRWSTHAIAASWVFALASTTGY